MKTTVLLLAVLVVVGSACASTAVGAGPVGTSSVVPGQWSLVVEPGDGLTPIDDLLTSARHTLDMTMYELSDAEVVTIVEHDAARGVTVRVLLDGASPGGAVNRRDAEQLSAHGVQVRWANSAVIFHQKTITADGDRSAIMTLNLTSRYYSDTRDFAVLTSDRSATSAIESVFDQDWTDSDRPQAGSSADGLIWSPGATGRLVTLVGSARHSILVENEEMDDRPVEAALEAAAGRGVSVEVVMTYSPEWLAAWRRLESAGVSVRTYAADAALYIHAKAVVVDGRSAFVGSQNFSTASLQHNRELGVVTAVPPVVAGVAATVAEDYAAGSPLPG